MVQEIWMQKKNHPRISSSIANARAAKSYCWLKLIDEAYLVFDTTPQHSDASVDVANGLGAAPPHKYRVVG